MHQVLGVGEPAGGLGEGHPHDQGVADRGGADATEAARFKPIYGKPVQAARRFDRKPGGSLCLVKLLPRVLDQRYRFNLGVL
jgi:hypothetical protein